MAISTGQITIVDYHDAVSLTGYIGANLALTQVYNPDNNTYSPSFTSTNLVLTPSLFKAGSGTDIITDSAVKSIKWFDGSAPTTELVNNTTYGLAAFATGTNRPLTVKQNILSGATMAKTFIVEVVFTDPATSLDLTFKTSITISRVNNSGGVTFANVTTPDGNIFKNGAGTNLTAKAELMRGSGVDTSSVTYQWYRTDSTVSTDQGGGIGWRKLDATTNFGTTGYTTGTLTIPATAVTSIAMFKCIIKDTDSASPTYNQSFAGTVSVVDQTDPIQVTVTSTGGDVFKQGVGSTTLRAVLYQNGTEIDSAGTKYTYKWYKYDQNGTKVTAWGGTGIDFKTGKTLAIGGADVDVKATFIVEVE